MKKKTIATAAISMAAGAGLGMMFAPKKGEELRKDLKKKIMELTEKIKNTSLDKIEKDLEDLDKEKVKKAAQKKADEIKKEIEKIIKAAKKKKDNTIEAAAEALREKAIEVTKDVLDKLEK